MIELEGVPELVDPVMVAAFEGWNDAGDAASTAVGHMEREWKGEVFAALDAEDYYDFQVNRPQVWLDGGSRKITWPTTRLSVVRVDDAAGKGRPRDLVLVRGIEPSMRWRSFCNEILGFAHELGVEMVVVLGALLGDTPHSRPVPVTGMTSDPDLARTMNVEESRYEGPTGIVGILQEACTHAGVPAVSLWASVPHYVSQPPNPKATLALLNRLEDLLELNVPLGELQEDARAWQLGVDQLAAEDSEVAEYVQSLEEARDTAELPEASGEAIAKEFERYLRRRDDGPGTAAGTAGGGRSLPSRQPSRAVREDERDGGKKDGDADGDKDADGADGGEGDGGADAKQGGPGDAVTPEASEATETSDAAQVTESEQPGKAQDEGKDAEEGDGDKPSKPARPAAKRAAKPAKRTGTGTTRGAKSTQSAKSTKSTKSAKKSSPGRGSRSSKPADNDGGGAKDESEKPAASPEEKQEPSAEESKKAAGGTRAGKNGKRAEAGKDAEDTKDADDPKNSSDGKGKGTGNSRSGKSRRKKTDDEAPGTDEQAP